MIPRPTVAAFADEVQKIAQRSKEDPGKKVMRGVMGGVVAPGVAQTAMAGLHKAMDDTNPMVRGKEETSRLVRQVAKDMNLKDVIHSQRFGSAFAADSDLAKTVGMKIPKGSKGHWINVPTGSGEATIAHELGHVKHMKKIPGYMRATMTSRRVGMPASGIASIYSAAKEDPSYGAAIGSSAISAPFVLDEASANAQALRHMVGRHGLRKGVSRSLHLAPAMGTYLTVAGAPVAITAVRKHLRKKREQDRQLKKQSGEVTLDRSHFVEELDNATRTPDRGPHPALNYEHQR